MRKTIHLLFAVILLSANISCDEHRELHDTVMSTCDILCTDGAIVRYNIVEKEKKTPVAVVFYVNKSADIEGEGYAVYLEDLPSCEFSDSIGIEHKTSSDISAFDGNMNTYKMYSTGASPLAKSVFEIWHYGQSAYIPSVAQMRLLYSAKDAINPYIIKCGGTPISDEASECWYWTSTEVEGQEDSKAWLYSLGEGVMQETNKMQVHKVRPIITLNK